MKRRLRFLTAEQVIAMREALLEQFGGLGGGGPRGGSNEGVEAAVQAVKNSYYETPDELAAAYAVYIVQGHVFLDGNKRAGAAAMLTFLQANAADITMPPQELASMMIDLQRRSEAGEDASRLIASLASALASRRARHKQRGT